MYINQNFSVMKKLFILSTLLLCSFLQTSCSTDGVTNNPVTTNPVDVYVAGSKNNQACYWKNGQVVMLDSSGFQDATANKIIVSNGDVYVLGYSNNNFYLPLFWKNNILSELNNSFNANFLAINDFDVVGDDVFICGYSSNNQSNGYSFGYWKNGNRIILNDNTIDHNPSYIKVVNNNVYVAVRFPQTGYYINSNFYQIPDFNISGLSKDINNVYLFGSKINSGYYYNVLSQTGISINFQNENRIKAMELDNIYYCNWNVIFKNSTSVYESNSQEIKDLKVLDDKICFISDQGFNNKLFINNVLAFTSLTDEVFNSLFIVQN
jgi:hypothetical protein